jgi:hypothetical protein
MTAEQIFKEIFSNLPTEELKKLVEATESYVKITASIFNAGVIYEFLPYDDLPDMDEDNDGSLTFHISMEDALSYIESNLKL